mgnify:CR=1 FL=1
MSFNIPLALFNGSYIDDKPSGIGVVARSLASHLDKNLVKVLDPLGEFPLNHIKIPNNLSPKNGTKGHLRRVLWTQNKIPQLIKKSGADFLISPLPEAPIFRGDCTGGKEISLSELLGKNVVLYFYPKDSTPGCTTEGQDFRDLKGQFTRANTVIFGLSRESIKSHEKFKANEKCNLDLISDPDEKICKQYDVIKEKSMYGKKYMGIERSTFLINAAGKLVKEWRKVKVTGHAKEVLEAAKEL